MRRIPSLPSRDHHRQRLLPLLDREVDLACQPAARPAESVVGRLDEDASGRLLPELPRPGRVLVGPAHVPSDQALGVCLGLELGEDPGPGSVPLQRRKRS
jgi:hypothetical protein